MTVPGNHDEARRDRVTTPGGSGAIEAVAGAADALELSGQYEHLKFIYPEPDDLSVTVDIGGLVVGARSGTCVSAACCRRCCAGRVPGRPARRRGAVALRAG